MYKSFFNYPITQPYPYRWFTPVVLVGGLILLVAFSITNFIRSSYILVVEYSENPNTTRTDGAWFRNWPSYLTTGVIPICQPASLPVNTQIFTNQSGLFWTLTAAYTDEYGLDALPTLPYDNNMLDICNITKVRFDLDNPIANPSETLPGIGSTLEVRAYVSCGIWSTVGYTRFNATAMYNPLPWSTTSGGAGFVAGHAKDRSSMFWAQSLLATYWTKLSEEFPDAFSSANPPIRQGQIHVWTDKWEKDIVRLDYFNSTYIFLTAQEAYVPSPRLTQTLRDFVQGGRDNLVPPDMWQFIDSAAKAMYYAVLVDLGQKDSLSISNGSVWKSFLQKYLSPPFLITWTGQLPFPDSSMNLASPDQPHPNPDEVNQLELKPSVISTNYVCQVPKRKSIGDIFLAVLLADLVLLQAAWRLYTFIVDRGFLQREHGANHCEGCSGTELKTKHSRDESTHRLVQPWDGDIALRSVPRHPYTRLNSGGVGGAG